LELALRVGLPAFLTLVELMQLFIGCHGHLELPGHLVVHLKQLYDMTVELARCNPPTKKPQGHRNKLTTLLFGVLPRGFGALQLQLPRRGLQLHHSRLQLSQSVDRVVLDP
jgi:hypothetical protein